MKKRLTALALAFAMVLGTVALAAGAEKSITVSPMTLTINGQEVTPTKSNGAAAEVFAYDGATYVPLRYLSELLGVTVEWDKDEPGVAKLTGDVTLPAVSGSYPDGTYTGVGAGMHSNIEVRVTVSGGKIAQVEILSQDETKGISEPALEQLPAAIVAANSPDVAAVSGATMTSNGIMAAVKNALSGSAAAGDELMVDPDIIVVGSGMAGLSTAVRSVELGLNVLMLEASVRVGGCIHFAGGTISGAGFKIQKENGVEDSPELFYADIQALGGDGEFNPALAKTHTERAKDAIDWLDEDLGVNFGSRGLVAGAYTAMPTPRVTRARDSYSMGAAQEYLEKLSGRVDEYIADGKIQIMFNTTVTELLVEGNEIRGVKAGDKTFTAPSVALCTGGYCYNEELLKLAGFENVISSAPSTSNGSGFYLAQSVGGVFDNMDEYVIFYGGGVPTNGFDMVYTLNSKYPGLVYVDSTGSRVGIEEGADINMWRNASESKLYGIISSDMIDEKTVLLKRPMGNATPLVNNGWGDLETLAAAGNCVYKADTLEELAEKIGAKDLTATVKAYNADAAKGTDSQFGRSADNMLPLGEGPYYAILTVPYVWSGTSGGVRADGRGYLQRADGSVIEGLSLAGEILGPSNILGKINFGGINHSMCATWGMIAAENAAARAK